MKPQKPTPDFPLYPHQNGQWAKKIRGKVFYFGKWDKPDEALKRYEAEVIFVKAGAEKPQKVTTGKRLTVKQGFDLFLTDQERRVLNREISQRTFINYRTSLKKVAEVVGKASILEDLTRKDWAKAREDLAKTSSLSVLAMRVGAVRIVSKWLYEAELIENPLDFGPKWKNPKRSDVRRKRNLEKRYFEPHEIRAILWYCEAHKLYHLHAFTLLGVFCGLGNNDCGRLKRSQIDLEGGWLDYPRNKTGVARRAKFGGLVGYSVSRAVASQKRTSKNGFLFVTKYGGDWFSDDGREDPIKQAFAKVLKALGLQIRGRGFYGLRRSCETFGGEAEDQVALDFVMGHIDSSMGGIYRGKISDRRLIKIFTTIEGVLELEKDDSTPEEG